MSFGPFGTQSAFILTVFFNYLSSLLRYLLLSWIWGGFDTWHETR